VDNSISNTPAAPTIYLINKYLEEGEYDELADLLKDVDDAIGALQQLRGEWLVKHNQMSVCSHEYGDAWYTMRRQLFFEIMYKFKRKCIHCGFIDTFEERSMKNCPEWGKTATEHYTNPDVL